MTGALDMPQLAARIYGVPLLIAKPKLDTILAAVGPRLLSGHSLSPASNSTERPTPAASRYASSYTAAGVPVTEDGVAVIPVLGTLVRRGSWLDAVSGVTSYAAIEDSVVEALTDPDVRAVMLEVDSHGGEAGGVFDLADSLRKAKAETGKPLWAISNENALSAGYAIASAADRVWVTRTGEVGSIGVVAAHVDQSAADAKAGVAVTYIYAGAHKVDGHPHGPLSAEVLADIQADIEGLYGMFTDQVAKARNMSVKSVRATEARTYRGTDAVNAGLADSVGTMGDALSSLSKKIGGRAGGSRTAQATGPRRMALMSPPEQPAPMAAAVALEAAQARVAEIMDIIAIGGRMGVTVDAAAVIKSTISPAALRHRVLDAAAEKSESGAQLTTIRSIPTPQSDANSAANSGWDVALGIGR